MLHKWKYSELTEEEKETRKKQSREYYYTHREELLGKRNEYYKRYSKKYYLSHGMYPKNIKDRNFQLNRLIPGWEYYMNLEDIFNYLTTKKEIENRRSDG